MKETIGSFMLVKNEAPWIAAHILRVLPFLDQMVLFDGDSTDGTLEIIKEIQKSASFGDKIKLFEHKDPADLQTGYTRMFDECMRRLDTDLAVFLHPDMWVENPHKLRDFLGQDCIMGVGHMESYAGEPGGQLFLISQGRGELWPLVYRLRNPDLGAHYFGDYGAVNEAVYFKEITGDLHDFHGQEIEKYPYAVVDVGLKVLHFSDVRPYQRRLSRMVSCLVNQGHGKEEAAHIARYHERVTLKDSDRFKFIPASYPPTLLSIRAKYEHLPEKEIVNA